MQALGNQMSSKVSVQMISKYEAGKMMPSSAVLVSFGKALDVSLDFLLGGQVIALEEIEFRKRSGNSARDRARVEVTVIERLENYFAILKIIDLPLQENPFGNLSAQPIESFEAIDAISIRLRNHWNLGLGPISSMCGLLEDKGMMIIETDLPAQFDGLACSVKRVDKRPDIEVIVTSRHTGVERSRFNLACELGRRIILATGNQEIRLEKAANYFAGSFLVPADHLIREAGECRCGMTYHELMRLKRIYGVSAAAMLKRLGQVGVISSSTLHCAFRGFARKWRTEEPAAIHTNEGLGQFERPQRFESLVWRALGEQLISPLRAAQFLGLSVSDIEHGIKGPQD